MCKKKAVHAPRVLDYEAQVVVPDESDSFLNVLWRPGVDVDYWHAPLLTRNAERDVEVTALDRPVGKGVRIIIGVFGSARLIRAPDTAVPASEDISTVSCGRVVARGGSTAERLWMRGSETRDRMANILIQMYSSSFLQIPMSS